MDFQEWCEGKSIEYLAGKLDSSKPEEILGFYLKKVFGDDLEYHKQFEWLNSKSHIDIYIISRNLAIEYDGPLHDIKGREDNDEEKASLCREKGVKFIRIKGLKKEKKKTQGDICYLYKNDCSNISKAIYQLYDYISKKYNLNIKYDVDAKRDEEEIIAYVREKYYKKTIAYKWPEVKDYWSSENEKSIFDVLCSEANKKYDLKCPHCKEVYRLMMKYDYRNRALRPCKCEYAELDEKAEEFISNYDGSEIVFNDTFEGRRLHDRVVLNSKCNLTNNKCLRIYMKLMNE